jgi:hypothetical protein
MFLKICRENIFIKPFSKSIVRSLSTQPSRNVIELNNNQYESDDYSNLTPKILSYLDKVS